MNEKEGLRFKAVEEGRFSDDFETRSSYWNWRVDNRDEDNILEAYYAGTCLTSGTSTR